MGATPIQISVGGYQHTDLTAVWAVSVIWVLDAFIKSAAMLEIVLTFRYRFTLELTRSRESKLPLTP